MKFFNAFGHLFVFYLVTSNLLISVEALDVTAGYETAWKTVGIVTTEFYYYDVYFSVPHDLYHAMVKDVHHAVSQLHDVGYTGLPDEAGSMSVQMVKSLERSKLLKELRDAMKISESSFTSNPGKTLSSVGAQYLQDDIFASSRMTPVCVPTDQFDCETDNYLCGKYGCEVGGRDIYDDQTRGKRAIEPVTAAVIGTSLVLGLTGTVTGAVGTSMAVNNRNKIAELEYTVHDLKRKVVNVSKKMKKYMRHTKKLRTGVHSAFSLHMMAMDAMAVLNGLDGVGNNIDNKRDLVQTLMRTTIDMGHCFNSMTIKAREGKLAQCLMEHKVFHDTMRNVTRDIEDRGFRLASKLNADLKDLYVSLVVQENGEKFVRLRIPYAKEDTLVKAQQRSRLPIPVSDSISLQLDMEEKIVFFDKRHEGIRYLSEKEFASCDRHGVISFCDTTRIPVLKKSYMKHLVDQLPRDKSKLGLGVNTNEQACTLALYLNNADVIAHNCPFRYFVGDYAMDSINQGVFAMLTMTNTTLNETCSDGKKVSVSVEGGKVYAIRLKSGCTVETHKLTLDGELLNLTRRISMMPARFVSLDVMNVTKALKPLFDGRIIDAAKMIHHNDFLDRSSKSMTAALLRDVGNKDISNVDYIMEYQVLFFDWLTGLSVAGGVCLLLFLVLIFISLHYIIKRNRLLEESLLLPTSTTQTRSSSAGRESHTNINITCDSRRGGDGAAALPSAPAPSVRQRTAHTGARPRDVNNEDRLQQHPFNPEADTDVGETDDFDVEVAKYSSKGTGTDDDIKRARGMLAAMQKRCRKLDNQLKFKAWKDAFGKSRKATL